MFEFDGKDFVLNGVSYSVVAKAHSNVVDSFVAPPNKTGTGSGEARLYVSSQSNDLHSAFFRFDSAFPITKNKKTYDGCPSKCFVIQDNLQKYMEDAKAEYYLPRNKHRKTISDFYDERVEIVNSMTEVSYFNVYNQIGDDDTNRFYIGSADSTWEIMRAISIPHITSLDIYKLMSDDGDILYFFELFLETEKDTKSLISKKKSEQQIEKQIKNDTKISETQRETVIKARKGQGKFRKNTLSMMPSCPFTGISEPSLLRASHIMPWAECKNNKQRLDGYNGLTLTPTYDLLFDLGLISFGDDGKLLVSNKLTSSLKRALNLNEGTFYDIGNSDGNKSNYLDYHRKKVYKKL